MQKITFDSKLPPSFLKSGNMIVFDLNNNIYYTHTPINLSAIQSYTDRTESRLSKAVVDIASTVSNLNPVLCISFRTRSRLLRIPYIIEIKQTTINVKNEREI